MKKYRVYITQVWTYGTFVEAENRRQAEELAGEIACDLMPNDMDFGDDYVEVEEVK